MTKTVFSPHRESPPFSHPTRKAQISTGAGYLSIYGTVHYWREGSSDSKLSFNVVSLE